MYPGGGGGGGAKLCHGSLEKHMSYEVIGLSGSNGQHGDIRDMLPQTPCMDNMVLSLAVFSSTNGSTNDATWVCNH